MKTEKNGILERCWARIRVYIGSPNFWFVDFLLLGLACFSLLFVAPDYCLPLLEFLPTELHSSLGDGLFLSGLFGFLGAFWLITLVILLTDLSTKGESSAEADKNKNENKE